MLSRICRFRAPVAAFLLSGLLAAPASADPIVGQLSILGTARFDSDTIVFQAPMVLPVGNFLNSLPSDGDFAGITGAGVALDLDVSAVGPVSVSDFLSSFQGSFASHSFELTFIQRGAFGPDECTAVPAASGQLCTPDESPFSFVNFSTGSDISSIVSFILRGNVTANGDQDQGIFTGVYTAQFTGLSYQEVLALIDGDGVTASYSANFNVVPEPAAAALLLAGLLGLALCGRRVVTPRR